MPEYKFSKKADKDLSGIALYTIEKFGIRQARKYRDGLNGCFQDLAERPEMGRKARGITKKYLLRHRYKSHVIFYTPTNAGVFIVRVLGERMDFDRHL